MRLRDRIWPLGERAFWARVCPLLWTGNAFWALLYWPRWKVSLCYLGAAVVLFIVGAACEPTPTDPPRDAPKEEMP